MGTLQLELEGRLLRGLESCACVCASASAEGGGAGQSGKCFMKAPVQLSARKSLCLLNHGCFGGSELLL